MIGKMTDEELAAHNQRVIRENDKYFNLPFKPCPLHGLVRDDAGHDQCRLDANRPWHQTTKR
jgi:hypothetical protein